LTPLALGFAGFAAIIVLVLFRVPIGLALAGVAILGLYLLVGFDIAMSMVRIVPFDFISNWDLSAIPMFLLMGSVAHRAGMTAKLFEAARLWFSQLPGGLAVATNFACAGFAAASGSSLATAMAIGRITIPEMLRHRYDPGLATGVVACAGTLGILIPPSIIMVIYGIFVEVSVAQLFIAGVLPGLLTAGIYAGQIVLRCAINPRLAPMLDERPTWGDRFGALAEVWPLPLLILGVIGSIYSGIATPTEAGAVGASLAVVIGVAQRKLTFAAFRDAAREAIFSTASIFFVAIGAVLLTRFMALSGVPTFLGNAVQTFGIDPLVIVLSTGVVYLVLGCFLDPLGMMLLTLPVFLPMFKAADIDLIWFGILLVKYIEIGLITPPVGLNVYGIKVMVPDLPLEVIFKGASWFLLSEIVIVALLIAFPQISLWLPSLMG
jgi:tripartite ATP-independent transporter DctM subunit